MQATGFLGHQLVYAGCRPAVDELVQHVAARPTLERVDVQRQKHSQGPKQVLGVPPLQAICEE